MWNSTVVYDGPILQGSLKVPITFLEKLSYALTIKGEGMIVSISRPIVRAFLMGHTFNVDPFSISTIETLVPMHSMVICKGLVWVAPLEGRSLLEKARQGWVIYWVNIENHYKPQSHCLTTRLVDEKTIVARNINWKQKNEKNQKLFGLLHIRTLISFLF